MKPNLGSVFTLLTLAFLTSASALAQTGEKMVIILETEAAKDTRLS